jgi:hypothetical protein
MIMKQAYFMLQCGGREVGNGVKERVGRGEERGEREGGQARCMWGRYWSSWT